VNAARCRPGDPILEAASLVGREPWDSTRARLFEGESVSVLISSRRDATDTSDVCVTVVAKAAALGDGGPVAVTLTGGDSSHTERLDGRGRCVIRGVPDGRYRIDMCRESGPDRGEYAAILLLPPLE
jgi:hypothetical protein